jgi:hypothetical protein
MTHRLSCLVLSPPRDHLGPRLMALTAPVGFSRIDEFRDGFRRCYCYHPRRRRARRSRRARRRLAAAENREPAVLVNGAVLGRAAHHRRPHKKARLKGLGRLAVAVAVAPVVGDHEDVRLWRRRARLLRLARNEQCGRARRDPHAPCFTECSAVTLLRSRLRRGISRRA